MERNKLLIADYLDILFEGRNKKYGSYDLRRKYAKRTRKATLIVLAGVTILFTIPVIAANLSENERLPPAPSERVIELAKLPPEVPKQPEINVDPAPAVREVIDNPVYKIVENKEVTEVPKTMEELKGKEIGLEAEKGTPGGIDPNLSRTGDGTGKNIIEQTSASEKPYIVVEQMPAFNGDLASYLREHLRYPDQAREAGEEGRVGIQFVVNEDGRISDVTVIHKAGASLDAEALRVVSSMPAWKPGKQAGKAVKVYFTLPITFKLD